MMRVQLPLIARGLTAAALTIIPAACAAHVQRPPLHGMQLSPAPRAADFTLTDQDGKPFEFARQTHGQTVLLYFGFTHCKDVCPQTLALLGKAREKARLTPAQVRIAMVSVDPAHDTPLALQAFFRRLAVRATGLTGSPGQLAPVYKAYGILVQRQRGDVLHTDTVFLIDKNGSIAETLTSQSSLKDIAADLQSVVK
jgi:protein SCO1/2